MAEELIEQECDCTDGLVDFVCTNCNGTGEGSKDGSLCSICHGDGEMEEFCDCSLGQSRKWDLREK